MGKMSKIDKEGGVGIAKKTWFPIQKLNHSELRMSSYSSPPFYYPFTVNEDSIDNEIVNMSSPKHSR